VPVALLLMLLTAVGPLLAWRKTSVESLKRNFLLPAIGSVAVGVMMIVLGVRPWEDPSYFYAVMAAVLSALVIFTVISEFVRGGRVIAGKSHQNLFGAMIHLYTATPDATEAISSTSASPWSSSESLALLSIKKLKKRWASATSSPSVPTPWSASPSRKTTIPTTPTSGRSSTYSAAQADHDYVPERRFYKASDSPRPPRIYPSFREDFFLVSDLYLVYEGKNETTGRPSSKPTSIRGTWIWIG